MGLRCLLGHDFGETEVEREREEDGNEMVVTIREVETCNRCGERRVVSENKEVTSIRSPEEVGLDEADEESADEPEQSVEQEAVTGAEPDTADHPAQSGSAPIDEAESESEFEPPQSAEEDDGVILEEDDSMADRDPGQWPDEQVSSGPTPMQDEATGSEVAEESEPSDDAGTGSGGSPPDTAAGSTDAGASAAEADAPSDDGVEFIDAEAADDAAADATDSASADETEPASVPDSSSTQAASDELAEGAADAGADDRWPDPKGEDEDFAAEPGDGEDLSFGGSSLTPDVESEQPDDADDAEFIEGAESTRDRTAPSDSGGSNGSPESDIARADTATFELSEPSVDSVFYCPNCEMTRPASQSSLRPGDICPECRKGYLTERDT